MSVEAMLAVQRLQVRTTHACFRVLMTLAEHANATGRNSWPSIDTIAAESQTDGKTTWRCLGALEKLELIVGERGRGPGRTTIWALNFPVRPLGKDGAKPDIPIETTPEKDGMTPCIEHEIPGTTPSFFESKHGMMPGIPR